MSRDYDMVVADTTTQEVILGCTRLTQFDADLSTALVWVVLILEYLAITCKHILKRAASNLQYCHIAFGQDTLNGDSALALKMTANDVVVTTLESDSTVSKEYLVSSDIDV